MMRTHPVVDLAALEAQAMLAARASNRDARFSLDGQSWIVSSLEPESRDPRAHRFFALAQARLGLIDVGLGVGVPFAAPVWVAMEGERTLGALIPDVATRGFGDATAKDPIARRLTRAASLLDALQHLDRLAMRHGSLSTSSVGIEPASSSLGYIVLTHFEHAWGTGLGLPDPCASDASLCPPGLLLAPAEYREVGAGLCACVRLLSGLPHTDLDDVDAWQKALEGLQSLEPIHAWASEVLESLRRPDRLDMRAIEHARVLLDAAVRIPRIRLDAYVALLRRSLQANAASISLLGERERTRALVEEGLALAARHTEHERTRLKAELAALCAAQRNEAERTANELGREKIAAEAARKELAEMKKRVERLEADIGEVTADYDGLAVEHDRLRAELDPLRNSIAAEKARTSELDAHRQRADHALERTRGTVLLAALAAAAWLFWWKEEPAGGCAVLVVLTVTLIAGRMEVKG